MRVEVDEHGAHCTAEARSVFGDSRVVEEVDQQLGHLVRRLDLRAVPDALEDLDPGAGDLLRRGARRRRPGPSGRGLPQITIVGQEIRESSNGSRISGNSRRAVPMIRIASRLLVKWLAKAATTPGRRPAGGRRRAPGRYGRPRPAPRP